MLEVLETQLILAHIVTDNARGKLAELIGEGAK